MKQLFHSATIKLTLWYLLILMSISLVFSIIIYHVSTGELSTRFDMFETRMQRDGPLRDMPTPFDTFRSRQIHDAELSLAVGISYTNLLILVFGGLGSYFLARRTLKPIEEVHESMSRFTSDASHELRTPLAVMKSELEVALRDPKLPKSEMYEILSSNLEEVNRLSDMVQMLLQLSRLEYQKLEIKPAKLDRLIDNARRHSASLRQEQTLKLDNHIRGTIYTNHESFTELLIILLNNAIQYSPSDAEITLNAKKQASDVLVTISNPGKGISTEALGHVFEPFYRADSSRTKDGEITNFGLGLPLAQRIVTALGGTIEIASQPNIKTTVKCRLPQSSYTILSGKTAK